MWKKTTQALDDLQIFLLSKAGKNGKLTMNQVVLAKEFGISHDRMHRLTQGLIEEGRMKVLGSGQHGMKTVVVTPI